MITRNTVAAFSVAEFAPHSREASANAAYHAVGANQMTPRDIPTRLRKTRANMLGTDDEQHYWDCHDAAAEIERLRLTDAEREAVWFFAAIDSNDSVLGSHAATLRALLERTK